MKSWRVAFSGVALLWSKNSSAASKDLNCVLPEDVSLVYVIDGRNRKAVTFPQVCCVSPNLTKFPLVLCKRKCSCEALSLG